MQTKQSQERKKNFLLTIFSWPQPGSRRSDKDCGVGSFIGENGFITDAEHPAIDHALDFTTSFLWVAMRVEFFLNIGASGPFPELLFHFLAGAGFFESQGVAVRWKGVRR